MQTDILGTDDNEIGVQVFDDSDIEHVVHVGWDGDIEKHYMDEYPQKREERTLEEQKIMTKVEERAKLAAQREFPDADILEPAWNPDELATAIETIQTLPVDRFAEDFEDCYRMLTEPASTPEVPPGSAQLIFQPFFLDETDALAYVPTPVTQYKPDGASEAKMTHREAAFQQYRDDPSMRKFGLSYPPVEFADGEYEFPDGFQMFVIEHLGAQMRDLYRHVGEQPPEPYADLDHVGKLRTADDDLYYEDF